MLNKYLRKKGPLLRKFWAQKPPIWVTHTRILNLLCIMYPPPPPGVAMTHFKCIYLCLYCSLLYTIIMFTPASNNPTETLTHKCRRKTR